MRYEENPFVEVEKLADGVWSLLSPGGCPTLCYLVEGTEKAMLIDTGFGVGDTKALCERLTDKPLVVVDTHSHGDHILGTWAAVMKWKLSTRPAIRPAVSACWRRSAGCSLPAILSCARPR